MLNKDPMAEYKIPAPSAFPASPLSAIGPPSNTVAMEEGVPGIFNKIAEINPPEIPPMYSPISNEIPLVGSRPKDKGRNRTTAMVADSPGMDPKMIPTTTPRQIKAKQVGLHTFNNACVIIRKEPPY